MSRSLRRSIPRKSLPGRLLSAVEVTDAISGSSLVQPRIFKAAGITAHHVRVNPSAGYQFQWHGPSHYLALHHLRIMEGETHTDVQHVDRSRDVRGRLTFIPSGCRVWGWSIPRAGTQSFTAVYLDPSQMETTVGQPLRKMPDQAMLYFTNLELRSTLEKLQRALSAPVPHDVMYVESLCLLGVFELCIAHQEKLEALHKPAGVLARHYETRIADYVDANLGHDIRLNDLANLVGLSRFHFVRAFKRTTQQTPYQYLLRRRIEHARLLLAEGDMTVGEIATAVGFRDASRFIRVFHKTFGTTPRAYRE